MTKIVGITGGFGSGKSTLSKTLIQKGFVVFDSDKTVKKIYDKPTKKFIKHLVSIGLAKSIKGNSISKKYISKIIFNNYLIKKKLEEYIFDIVRRKRNLFIKKEKKKKTKTIFLDIPLLFENKLDYLFDTIVCVITKRDTRYKRIKKNKKISYSLFNKVLRSQTSDVIRKKRAHKILHNNSSKKNFLIKIDRFATNFKK